MSGGLEEETLLSVLSMWYRHINHLMLHCGAVTRCHLPDTGRGSRVDKAWFSLVGASALELMVMVESNHWFLFIKLILVIS